MKYVAVYLCSIAVCLFIYWVGGNDFERNGNLAGTLVMGILVGMVFNAAFLEIEQEKEKQSPKPKTQGREVL